MNLRLEIDEIRFRNFLSFGAKWQEIKFLHGLNLILGLDLAKDRSNASGKSSFLETVPYALFGKVNRNINKDQIVNWRNRKNCEVTITFHKNNDEYIIHRGIKPDILEVTKNGTEVPIDADKRIFQKYLEDDIIGIDFNTFMSLIYTNINYTVPVLTMKTVEKRKFLERIFNLQLFNKVNDKINDKLKSVDKKIYETKLQREFNEKTIKESHNNISDIQGRIQNLTSSKSELEDATERYEKLLEGHDEDKKEFKKLQDEIDKNTELEGYYSTLLTKINSKSSNLQFKIKTLEKQADVDRVKRDLAEIKMLQKDRDGYGDADKLKAEIEEAEKEKSEVEREGDGHLICKIEYEKEIASFETLMKQDEGHLKTMEDEDECPLCGEKITEKKINELKKKMKMNAAKLGRAKEGKKEAASQMESVRRDKNARMDSIRKMKDTLITIIRLDGNIKEKKAVLKSLDIKSIKKKTKMYQNALEKIDGINAVYKEKQKAVNAMIKAAQEDQEQYKKRIDSVNALASEIERLSTKVENEEKLKISFHEMIESEKAKIITLSEENKKFQGVFEKYDLISDYLRYIKLCCKDENIKQYVISSNMPHINRKTNEYLSEVGHGFYVIIDKWLEAEIKGPGIVNASYGNLSGGEGRSIDISLQMALLDHARKRAGLFPDILITDELLDSSIDSYGLERVMKIVKSKQINDNLKIFLVSHRKEVSDIDVDRTYLVEKTGGFSHITLS